MLLVVIQIICQLNVVEQPQIIGFNGDRILKTFDRHFQYIFKTSNSCEPRYIGR